MASFTLLPRNLGCLAEIAPKESYRYANSGVRLKTTQDGYLAESTDGACLARVVGTSDKSEDFPEIPAILSAPNGQHESTVPAKEWKNAFRAIPKGSRYAQKPILENLAVVQGERVTTLASTNLEATQLAQPVNVEGRWPETDQVFPNEQAVIRVRVDPKRLAKMLELAANFTSEENFGVELHIYANGKPMLLQCANGTQQFSGLLMPLSDK